MNYVGKLLSNFKGFYNEINSATLTGAIDVVIVQQEDGTYVSSPFHVRFGKMGVLRAREKVVDIEINGQCVELHMKLGEGGAAFFVQEAGETAAELPPYLATSPIMDSLELMEEGLKQLRQEAEEGSTERTRHDSEPSPRGDTSRSSRMTSRRSELVLLPVSSGLLTSDSSKLSTDIAIQTDMTGSEVENKARSRSSVRLNSGSRSDKSRTPPGERSTQTDLPSGGESSPKLATSPKLEVPSGGHSPKVTSSLPGVQKSSSDDIKKLSSPISKYRMETEVTSANKTRRKRRKKPQQRLKPQATSSTSTDISHDKTDRSHLEVASIGTHSGSSCEMAGDEMFEMELSDEEGSIESELPVGVGRTYSMPIIEERQAMTDEWANSQFATHLHPFSDGDITPIMSPISTRPPSPKSDTEFETQKHEKYDATVQTKLTGDDMANMDDVKWEWGELPISTAGDKPHDKSADQSHDKMRHQGDDQLFHFMRETKKIRHQPEKEGIYLDDLEMDPELAALYLYPKQQVQRQMRESKDEDNESGRGASLPHSPVTVERESHDLERPISQSSFSGLPDISMSLCGGLSESEGCILPEKFHQYWVSYDDFCENPAMMSNPNLVIHMGDKYYNWDVAGPIIISAMAFHRPLPETAVDKLAKKTLPKKERRRGWFSWGRGNSADVATGTDSTLIGKKDENGSPISSPASSATNSPQRVKERKRPRRRTETGDLSSDDESDTSTKDADEHKSNVEENPHLVYRKSLKLTSEQIAALNLKEGVNEVSFSVTTQYQGTSRCTSFIYLWKWDDRIVISDIDGTITKSDVLGQVLPMIGKDWSQAGIANLYSMISRNGYKFLYLSARAIGQSKITRDYLKWIQQGHLKLPEGPLLLSPSSLISAFHKEVIERKPEEFKIGCLRDIAGIFPTSRNPFYSGFGNKINDVWAYRAVGIPISRIFTVNHRGELKMCHAFQSTYSSLTDIVDHFFPPLLDRASKEVGRIQSGNFPAPDEFSTFTYWRAPLLELESDELDGFDLDKKKEKEKKKDSVKK